MKSAATIVICVAAFALIGSGCHQTSATVTTNANAPGAGVGSTPAPADSTRLRQGIAPISYLVGTGGNIRIVDTTDSAELFKGAVDPQTIVNIDTTKGISVSNRSVKPGPLPQGHRYEIWLDRK